MFGSDVQEALMAHLWPGNVRELRNVVSYLHYLAKSRAVALTDLPREVMAPTRPNGAQFQADHAQDQRLARALSLKHAEVMLIESSLAHHNGNISKSALALGISRPTLYRKIETLGIRSETGKGLSFPDQD